MADRPSIRLGYALSSEEHGADSLVRWAREAEEAGFEFALISDHFHPWTDREGQSPFAWTVLGAIARETTRLRLGTGVTCPIRRYHPAIVAQAAATVASLMPGRFFLGVGTGEALNEHVLGQRWPSLGTRQAMLEEAVEVIRLLWSGGRHSHDGRWFSLENARIYSLPETPPPIYVAASGEESARLAGRIGDGLISTVPESSVVRAYTDAAPTAGPRIAQLTVCWATDDATARRTALEWWPQAALHGELSQELPLPLHFEQAVKGVTEEAIAEAIVCGPDPVRHIDAIRAYADAGFDHVYVHQVGPEQAGFMDFYAREILPAVASPRARAA
jgi:coenzyme F420-dependent glucose-6-phosphate dehydrogenase